MAVLNNSALVGASGKGGTGAITTPQRSLRFNSADASHLYRLPGTAGNRRTFTLSWWMKRSGLFAFQSLFNSWTDASNRFAINFDSSIGAGSPGDYLTMFNGSGGVWNNIFQTNAVFRDPSAWYHCCLAVDTTQAVSTDRVKLWINNVAQTFSSYTAPGPSAELNWNSATAHYFGVYGGGTGNTTLAFNGYLAFVHHIDSQALAPSAFAYTDPATGRWEPKAYAGSYSGNSFYLDFSDNSAATATTLGADRSGLGNNWVPNNLSATAAPYFYPPSGGGGLDQYIPAGWTRTNNPSDVLVNNQTGVLVNQSGALMFAIKPTSSSITIKWIVYDGSGTYTPNVVLNTSSSWSNTLIGPSSVSGNGSTGSPSVGTYSVTAGTTYYVSTYGQGNPALVVYATNVTIEPIGTSASGIDSLRDHPVSAGIDGGLGGEVSGNYCTWNPLLKSSYVTLSNGNLDSAHGGSGAHARVTGTFGLTSGKWYYEATLNAVGGQWPAVGVALADTADQNTYVGAEGGTFGYYPLGGVNGGGGGRTYSSYTAGDVIGVAIDIDNQRLTFYKNGVAAVTAGTSYETLWAGVTYVPAVSGYNGGAIWTCNFGQRPWAYPGSVPAGFKALCDQNLPAPLIARPSTAMDVVTYVGNGGSTRTISGLQFSPDLVWTKSRNQGYGQNWFDTVRGAGNVLRSDIQNPELSNSSEGYLSSFNVDGYTMSAGSNTSKNGNELNTTYVGWAWDAGGQPTTDNVAGAGNVPTAGSAKINGANMTTALAGSIPATRLSANTAAGFSVVSWTGGTAGTVGHGLNTAPGLVITKSRTSMVAWRIWHSSFSSLANYIGFDTGSTGTFPNGNYWQAFTSSTIGFTGGYDNNTGSMIAYCFAPVAGYSAFGVYSGGTVGTFVHLGFTPKFLLVHSATGSIGDAWKAYDSTRSPYNARADFIAPNAADAEVPNNLNQFDFVSNGFVVRSNTIYDTNFANHTYLYCAFAESPFRYSRAR